jgi:hypothetical protein
LCDFEPGKTAGSRWLGDAETGLDSKLGSGKPVVRLHTYAPPSTSELATAATLASDNPGFITAIIRLLLETIN